VVAFLTALAVTVLGTALIFLYGARRPVGQPITWAEGMLGAVYVYGLMILAYGILPNQWLQWTSNELNWRPDAIGIPTGPLPFKGHTLFADGITFFGRGQLLVSKETVRDIVAALIYVVVLGANIALWAVWQKRGKKKDVPAIATSTYGRPLVKKV
jgi:hypothetical protein